MNPSDMYALTTPLTSLAQVSLVPFFTCIQITLATWLFAGHYLPRKHFGLRVLHCIGLLATFVLICSYIGFILIPALTVEYLVPTQFLTFSLALVLSVSVLMYCYDIAFANALFAATAGYTLQNLASGIEQCILLLVRINNTVLSNIIFALISLIISIILYGIAWRLLAQPIRRHGQITIQNLAMVAIFAFVILINIGFDLIIKGLPFFAIPHGHVLALRIIHLITCMFILMVEYELLYNRHLQQEVRTIQQILSESERQYRISKETIEAINIKSHDLKHQIRLLSNGKAHVDQEMLKAIQHDVECWDATVSTGNDALDVILTEKSLLCSAAHISLSIIADGEALTHMKDAEIYSLFGNALDNAYEAVSQCEDPEKRAISVVIRSVAGMCSIHIENYFALPQGKAPSTFNSDGQTKKLPSTTKDDPINHGFGLKSIQAIVHSYDGSLTFTTCQDIFHLNILIPQT